MALRSIGPFAGILPVLLLSAGTSSSRAPVPVEVRTYQFRAKIKTNAGVTPLEVGKTISGRFTYDLRSEPVRKGERWAHLKSKRNALSFEFGDLRFVGAGATGVSVSSRAHAEHFGLGGGDLVLPEGWEVDDKQGSRAYAITLQNVPPKKVIDGIAIPTGLSLSDFTSTAELRLDFRHGVRFPGGAVTGRATVLAPLETLEAVRR
jgi:hypothetical protein